MEIEICTERLDTAIIADQLGADRIELCTALDLGGLTPSMGLIEQCVNKCSLEVHVMIRNKQGGFVYTDDEIAIMMRDIEFCHDVRAHGVVFGCLTQENELNMEQNSLLINHAKSFGLVATFHRAIDFCNDIENALDVLIEQGFDRILTSGQAPTAMQGRQEISNLVKLNKGRVELMAGSGVNVRNAEDLINTGVNALHFTARKLSGNSEMDMGNEYCTDIDKIKNIMDLIERYNT